MATYRANVQYLVSLNNSKQTTVNVLRKPGPGERTYNANAGPAPNVILGTGYSPSQLEPGPDSPGGEYQGIFMLRDYMTPVTKTVTANSLSEAIALFRATYGPDSLTDTPEVI